LYGLFPDDPGSFIELLILLFFSQPVNQTPFLRAPVMQMTADLGVHQKHVGM